MYNKQKSTTILTEEQEKAMKDICKQLNNMLMHKIIGKVPKCED